MSTRETPSSDPLPDLQRQILILEERIAMFGRRGPEIEYVAALIEDLRVLKAEAERLAGTGVATHMKMDEIFDCPTCGSQVFAHLEDIGGGSTQASFQCAACSASASAVVGSGSPFDGTPSDRKKAVDNAIRQLSRFARR